MSAQTRCLSSFALISTVAVATLAGSNLALGQAGAATQPATGADTAAPAVVRSGIVALAVSGKVTYRPSADAKFSELKPGQQLNEGAEILTSANAIAQIKIGEGQVYTIDRIGRVLIKDAVKAAADGKHSTVLQLPYGRIRFDVTSTKVANDVKIQTPDATLAVKGTHGVIEKIPGHPTRAYGGELNAGIVNIMYVGGINVDVSKQGSSSADQVQPARAADAETFVQTGDGRSSDQTNDSAGWSPTGGLDSNDQRSTGSRYTKHLFQPVVAPHNTSPLSLSSYASLDRRRAGTVTLYDLTQSPGASAGSGLSGFFGTPQGAASIMTPTGPAVIALDDNAGNSYAAGTMALRQWSPGLKRWQFLGALAPLPVGGNEGLPGGQSAYALDGLGNLAGHIYASGINPAANVPQTTGHFGVFELTFPQLRGGAVQAQQRMSFPMLSAGGGMTGANSRGTMFVAAQFNLESGSLPGMVLLEVDPRTNYIANAWSVADGSFDGGNGGGSIDSSFAPSGVAFVNGQVVLSGRAGQTPATYSVVPNALDRADPRVASARVGPGSPSSNALAGDGGFTGAASLPLAPRDRKATPIDGIDPIWLSTAYSRRAAASATFRRMMRDTVLSVASNPAACAVSTQLGAGLSNAIADHYNEQAGVNSALNQFYASLPPNHPCRCNTPASLRR